MKTEVVWNNGKRTTLHLKTCEWCKIDYKTKYKSCFTCCRHCGNKRAAANKAALNLAPKRIECTGDKIVNIKNMFILGVAL